MIQIKQFPNWFQKDATSEGRIVTYNSFAKAKFFLLDRQISPYGRMEFGPSSGAYVVDGDKSSAVTHGFSMDGIIPNQVDLRTNANNLYDNKFGLILTSLPPEIDGDDIIFDLPERGRTPVGDPATKVVISPLSAKELKAARTAYGLED